ncbi:MAG: 30S ribosomal protein S3 [Saprospirales bacterium]|nr:30S ribosomal protein S3 [Saprospirales bacterium]
MGQKANPIGNRLGIIRGWDSNWFADKDYGLKVVEDEKIRNYLQVRRPKTATADPRDRNKPMQNGISRIIIERTLKRVTVTIQTSRPGIIIGKGGKEVDLIKEELKILTGKDVQINIFEIRKPELDANIVGEQIAKQIEARINFRRAIKGAIQGTMRAGAEGIKIRVSGRLGGAEIARTEEYKEGRTPLHTFRADIDYALVEALTVYGKIGIKVWLFKGEVLQKRELTPFAGTEGGERPVNAAANAGIIAATAATAANVATAGTAATAVAAAAATAEAAAAATAEAAAVATAEAAAAAAATVEAVAAVAAVAAGAKTRFCSAGV